MTSSPPPAVSPTGPNAEQIRYWNERGGTTWVSFQDRLTAQIRPLGERALERAGLAPGQHVLEVGCGCGEIAVEIARRVGPEGRVTGIDISAVMLARAREVVAASGLGNIAFVNADAQTAELPAGAFDALFSRFGVIFFSDPEAAFQNLRRALKPGARLAFVCWRAFEENPWMRVPIAAVEQHVEVQRPEPGAPGLLSLADPERVSGMLQRAGFAQVRCEPFDEPILLGGGGDLENAVELMLQFGPIGTALSTASPAQREAATRSLRDALGPYARAEGVRIPAGVWVVTGAAR